MNVYKVIPENLITECVLEPLVYYTLMKNLGKDNTKSLVF